MSLDAAAKRALFDAVGPASPRTQRSGLDVSEARQNGSKGGAFRPAPRSGAAGGLVPIEQSGRDPGAIPFDELGVFVPAHQLAGRWMMDDRYRGMRNAAWAVRNSRVGQANNPAALALVRAEAVQLIRGGEPLQHVVEALCELLVHP